MANLRYLVLRTPKKNSSAFIRRYSTTRPPKATPEKAAVAANSTRSRNRILPRRQRRSVLEPSWLIRCGRVSSKGVKRGRVNTFSRVFWIVLDSVGIGELPDAADYDDVGRSTLGHIADSRLLQIPN